MSCEPELDRLSYVIGLILLRLIEVITLGTAYSAWHIVQDVHAH